MGYAYTRNIAREKNEGLVIRVSNTIRTTRVSKNRCGTLRVPWVLTPAGTVGATENETNEGPSEKSGQSSIRGRLETKQLRGKPFRGKP